MMPFSRINNSWTLSPLLRVAAWIALVGTPMANTAVANFIQNADFTQVTYSGALPMTTLYGQFGSGTGSTLTLANWTTSGYNFVFAPGTVDVGTQANGANNGQPKEAPGQYNAPNGYGNTFMWGSNNGGLSTWPTNPPSGGNFIAADGIYEVGALTQTVTGLTVGKSYQLTFWWGAAQQQGFDGITTENWKVTFGSQNFTTSTYTLSSHSFSGWMQQTFTFTASNTTQTLSFLAQGTPSGLPPFAVLSGVDLELVPEIAHWAIFAGFGALTVSAETIRRRRRRRLLLT